MYFQNGQEIFIMPEKSQGKIILNRPVDFELLDRNNDLEFTLTVQARVYIFIFQSAAAYFVS